MKFLLMILVPSIALASTEIEDAKRSIKALVRPLLAGSSRERPQGTEKFRVDKCDTPKIDWMAVLLGQTTATVDFKFKEGCDVQGTVTPKMFAPFKANLDLRNLQSYSRIETMNKVTANLETRPILNLEMREGLLTGKENTVKFEADYSVRINATGGKTVTENLGGVMRISEINGKKVDIKEKIFVK